LVYALDCSDSIGEKVSDQALAWILKTAGQKPQQDQAGLVVFGRDAAVELPPRQAFPFEAINTRVAKDGTNLEQALTLAAAVMPEENPGRIALISDGTTTEGDVDRAIDQLVARKVPVDVVKIEYARDHEVWLERIELPQEVRPEQTYEAAVILGSIADGFGDLVLRENGREILRRQVDYRAGKNRYTLPLYLRGPGFYEYAAVIEPPPGRDGWRENNIALGSISLQGEGRILLVTDADGAEGDWRALERALGQSKRSVEVQTAQELPEDPLAYLAYDAVVMVNVPADAVGPPQQLAIRDAVYDLGVGLLMVGGQNSYGPGGWNRTPIEEALPVTMDINQRKVMPKGALALILHTCEFPEGNTWAKRITKQAVKVLGARDDVGVIDYGYGGGEQWVFPMTPAGDFDKLAPLIEAAEPGDMPSFAPTMRMALDGLKADDAAAKHLIIISDGDPSPPPPEMVQEFITNKISVSMVAIFPHGGTDPSVMKAVAEATGGRYYFPREADRLPSIFIKEAKTLKRSQVQNNTFTPKAGFPSPILKGLDSIPALKGYVLTTPKPRALTILEGPDPEEEDPVLSVWRYGVGTAAAWTSDLGSNWAVAWVEWEKYQAFVEQLMTHIGRSQEATQLRLRCEANGNVGMVTVEDHAPNGGFLEVAARVTTPTGGHLDLVLKQVAPGRYAGDFPIVGTGRFQVMVSAAGGTTEAPRRERVVAGLAVPYSAEYLRFRANPTALERIAQRTGGRVLMGNEDGATLFGVDRRPRRTSRPVFDRFLIALAILLPLDIALRRVQLDFSGMLARLRLRRKGAEASTATMGALLSRKQQVALPSRDPAHAPMPFTPSPTRPASTSAPPKPARTAGAPSPPPGSTTGRLLEAKRKRQERDQPPDPPASP
ncbi:MAG: VWA domain-containing protein, partial [Planctomycetes bacterium]|nr:VWA domain-containing protein [Planctomycetota bacterium]